MILRDSKPAQIGFVVADVREAARCHAALYGSGPFYVGEHTPMAFARYRGEEVAFDHSAAFGQWGDVMVEMIQQHAPEQSVILDGLDGPPDRPMLHHMAFIVDHPRDHIDALARDGHALALHCQLQNGLEAFMVDARSACGHFIELYEPTPPLVQIYDFIRDTSLDWDGRDPVRSFTF